MDKTFWQSVVDAGYAVPAGHSLENLTAELLTNLGSPDPELRDRYAYFILGTWIENGHYSPAELRTMTGAMTANLACGIGEPESDSVFLRAFSALILGEIVAHDNRRPFLTRDEVLGILEQALAYLAAEQDTRGHVEGKGWAHAIAHAADLLDALAESQYLGAAELRRLLDGIAARVTAPVTLPYLHDEDERLVRAVLSTLGRHMLDLPYLSGWLESLANPPGRRPWIEAFLTPEDQGARHNTKQFLRSLYFQLLLAEQPPFVTREFLPLAVGAIRAIRNWA